MKNNMTFLEKTKRFFEPVKYNKLVYFWGVIIYFMWSIDRVIHVLFLERIVYFLEKNNTHSFLFVLKIYIAYLLFYTFFTTLSRRKGWTEISNTVSKFLQNFYLRKFVRLGNNYTEKYGTGKLTAIIDKGMDRWGELMDIFLQQSIGVIVSFIFTCYMLSQSSSWFVVIFIFVYFLFYVISYFLNLGALKYRKFRRDFANDHTKNLVKILMNKQEILQSGKISHELKTLDHYDNQQIFYNKKIADFLQPLFEGPNIVSSFVILLLLYILGNAYLQGELTISVIVGIISALVLMKDAIDRGIMFFKDFTKNFVDVEKLWDFFDEASMIERYEQGKTFEYKKGEVFMEGISYSYVAGKNILENFSLHIEGGRITALVGPSGGGKSTIAKLIGGYLSVNIGKIYVDAQSLDEVSFKSYYQNIGYLTQEPSVFDGTVLDNLTYAVDQNISQKKIQEIIRLSNCDFIHNLPKGLETEIGERGVKLSGGQRQRLAIAKIMLKDLKIIILDEPTSALDSFSEEQITKAMNNLFKGRTVLVIAHRLQTVKHADKIFLIENGKVVEEGSHSELKKKKGKYYKMLELQSGF